MIFALMPTRNEAGRYLECVLTHLHRLVDVVVVYDDWSTDDTLEMAETFPNVFTVVRSEGDYSFAEHEGRFRQAAWDAFNVLVCPSAGDWVLSIDADEIPVAESATVLAEAVEQAGAGHFDVPIPEVFDLDPIGIRTDGHWHGLTAPRLFAWQPGGTFVVADPRRPGKEKPRACTAVPAFVAGRPAGPSPLTLLHLGYAHPDDRAAKFKRYADNPHGHREQHIVSIGRRPRLEPWPEPVKVWRGMVLPLR